MTGDPARDHEATEHHFATPDVPWIEDDYTAAQRAEKKPCSCWQQVTVHSGHCCFDDPDHEYDAANPLPCEHTDPREQP